MSAQAEREEAMPQALPGQDKAFPRATGPQEGSQETEIPVSSAWSLLSLVRPQFLHLYKDAGNVRSNKLLLRAEETSGSPWTGSGRVLSSLNPAHRCVLLWFSC